MNYGWSETRARAHATKQQHRRIAPSEGSLQAISTRRGSQKDGNSVWKGVNKQKSSRWAVPDFHTQLPAGRVNSLPPK